MGFPPGHPPMRSFLGVPIFVRDVVYGDLYLAEKEGGEFTEDDQEIVTLLAAQTGITIERVQIHEGPSTGSINSRRSTSSPSASWRSGTSPACSSSSPVACAS